MVLSPFSSMPLKNLLASEYSAIGRNGWRWSHTIISPKLLNEANKFSWWGHHVTSHILSSSADLLDDTFWNEIQGVNATVFVRGWRATVCRLMTDKSSKWMAPVSMVNGAKDSSIFILLPPLLLHSNWQPWVDSFHSIAVIVLFGNCIVNTGFNLNQLLLPQLQWRL